MLTMSRPTNDSRAPAKRFALCITAAVLLLVSLQVQCRAPTGRQTYWFLVFSDAIVGQEAEYNRWYSEEHGPDVTSIPGFVSGRRYVLADQQLRKVDLAKPKYLVIYTIVTSHADQVTDEIEARIKDGRTRLSPTITNVKMYSYRAFRPEQKGVGRQPTDAPSGSVESYIQVVFGNAVKHMDKEFNTWYDHVHEPELLAVPGFVRAQRGIISEVQFGPIDKDSDESRYLTLFEIQSSDLAVTFSGLKGLTEPVPAFDRARTYGYTYKAIGAVMDGDQIRATRAAGQSPHGVTN